MKYAPEHLKKSYLLLWTEAYFLYHIHWFINSTIWMSPQVSNKSYNISCYHKKDCPNGRECENYAFYYSHTK